MTERWERMAKALLPGAHLAWESSWNERKLADLNDTAVYDRLAAQLMEAVRELTEDIDVQLWDEEVGW